MALGSARPLQATDLWKMDDARSAGLLSQKLLTNYMERDRKAKEYNEKLSDPNFRLPWKKRISFALRPSGGKREKEWREKTGKRKASLAWALSDTFGWYFWSAGFIKFVGDLSGAFSPLVVRAIIKWSTEYEYARTLGTPKPSIGRGIGMAIGLFAMLSVYSISAHHFFISKRMTEKNR